MIQTQMPSMEIVVENCDRNQISLSSILWNVHFSVDLNADGRDLRPARIVILIIDFSRIDLESTKKLQNGSKNRLPIQRLDHGVLFM